MRHNYFINMLVLCTDNICLPTSTIMLQSKAINKLAELKTVHAFSGSAQILM